MKKLFMLFFAILIGVKCLAQTTDNPFFAKLAEYKSTGETALKARFAEEQLKANAIVLKEDKDKAKEIKLLEFYEADKRALYAYSKLKVSMDVLVNQLKADLTVSNRKKNLKNLNNGILTGWYQIQVKKVTENYNDFIGSLGGSDFKAVSVSDVTGIFSALVTVITSSRDFRAQMVTTMCAQLDSLKLTDAYDIMSGNASGGATSSPGAATTKPASKH